MKSSTGPDQPRISPALPRRWPPCPGGWPTSPRSLPSGPACSRSATRQAAHWPATTKPGSPVASPRCSSAIPDRPPCRPTRAAPSASVRLISATRRDGRGGAARMPHRACRRTSRAARQAPARRSARSASRRAQAGFPHPPRPAHKARLPRRWLERRSGNGDRVSGWRGSVVVGCATPCS